MNRLGQEALIARLTRRLREEDTWAGETHVQKASYLAKEIAEVPLEFEFILYKHGPFSFELRDELEMMEADRYIVREPQTPPYGPRLRVTERGESLERRFGKTMTKYGPRVEWIAAALHGKGVAELERLATALFVTRQNPAGTATDRAAELAEIKRHVREDAALAAVHEIDSLLEKAPAVVR